ncbi:MAG: hypothetical protein QNK37_11995 [Acidobacteriota bacterium]|nr:hypothetical protein [Acidobacteriota bacterium]
MKKLILLLGMTAVLALGAFALELPDPSALCRDLCEQQYYYCDIFANPDCDWQYRGCLLACL